MAKKRTGPSPRQKSEDTKAERDARVADMMDRVKHHLHEADRFRTRRSEPRSRAVA